MNNSDNDLPFTPAELAAMSPEKVHELIVSLTSRNQELTQQLLHQTAKNELLEAAKVHAEQLAEAYKAAKEKLEHRLHDILRQVYGTSAESDKVIKNLTRTTERNVVANETEACLEKEERKREVGRRQPRLYKPCKLDIDNLPVEERVIELTKEELESCGYSECGERIVLKLQVSKSYSVIRYRIKQYQNNNEFDENGNPLKVEAELSELIPESILTPSLLTDIVVKKYGLAVPLYRIEKQCRQNGLNLSRSLIAHWLDVCYNQYIKPFMEHFKREIITNNKIIHADETPVPILKNKKNGYLWLYCTPPQANQVIYMEINPGRNGDYPREFLKDFNGYLVTDNYSGYAKIDHVTHVYCLAHVRRKFVDVLLQLSKNDNGGLAGKGYDFCEQLYRVETELRSLTWSERAARRKEELLPIINHFETWLNETITKVLDGSSIHKAIKYAIKCVPSLRYLADNGQLEIDNNISERAIKNYVIGRKNFLFHITDRGAEVSASYYTLLLTAEANGLNPVDYLNHLFTVLPTTKINQLSELAPWHPQIKSMFSKND